MEKIPFLAFMLPPFLADGQNIKLKNPSFENVDNIGPRLMYRDKVTGEMKDTILTDVVATTAFLQNILDWQDCGQKGETPPDIHPTNRFGVTWAANEGKFYLGMVTRDNGTWEALGQKLTLPLKTDTCYELSAWMMCSPIYKSKSRKTGQAMNYTLPARLRVWGGNDICEMKELLIMSEPVLNRAWLPQTFVFKPKKKIKYLRFEAYYTEGANFYNGNLLLDNLSEISPCSCSKLNHQK